MDSGNLKLHLVNSEPINSMFITATPFDWMEVSLRYADINTTKYSPFFNFSGNQTFKDKSFNLKLKLIEETKQFPELSIGFRDFIGTGKFSGEYIVTSKKIGDFDFSLGLGWGSLSDPDGINNPFGDLDNRFFLNRGSDRRGGNFNFNNWFRGKKASAFYGFEYLNKYSGLRFKLDYDRSSIFGIPKNSHFSYGLSIPATKFVDINLFRHRGTDFGFGFSYKANYKKSIIKKNETIPIINFSDKDLALLESNDQVFSGTINVLLSKFGIYVQEIFYKDKHLSIIIDQGKYRNLNIASKRVIQLTKEVLNTRDIRSVSITHQTNNVNTSTISIPLDRFENFLEYSFSLPELNRFLEYKNYYPMKSQKKIFNGDINFPSFYWAFEPSLKNHVGAPETFYSGQLGLLFGAGIKFNKQSSLDGTLSFSIYSNLDQLRLRSWSRLPKVRSDIREYLKEGENSIKDLTYSYIFDPIYNKNFLFFGGIKLGLYEEMFGGLGGELLFRDISKPWYLTANYHWVKQREFDQLFSFRDYETFTGHLSFIWETPLEGTKLIISGGKYLAKDSGVTVNFSKSFRSGFTLGFFATKTDISSEEFGEGSFDKGIYFSIPLEIVSSKYRKGNARFLWRNLTKDGGAILSGGLDLGGYIENNTFRSLKYIQDGFYE